MGNAKKLLAGLLTLVMFLCLFNGTEVKAARKGNPQIRIFYLKKLPNSKLHER